MSYDNTNRGILFRNDRKDTEQHPDYTGKLNIEGQEHYLSAWLREGKKGKFLSLSIGKPVESAPRDRAAPRAAAPFRDEIPF